MAISIHFFAALWAIVAGTSQLLTRKGTRLHKVVGWSWMVSMVVVAISSFWLTGFMDVLWGSSPIHLLSIWVLFCVASSIYSARVGNIKSHKAFAVGAFFGVIGAGLGALAPGRLLNQWLLGG